ncbi:MAG: YceI family protein [Bacteroidetes bacterium]|nr:YceI family protein [Bacteroidota bacterium]
MIQNTILLLFVFLNVSGFSQGQSQQLFKSEHGFVKFISDAPLEFITAESNDLLGLVDPLKKTFAFRLDVKTLKGFNSPLQQEHFYENYIESDQYPTASFSGKIIEGIEFETSDWQNIRAKGILNIHGVDQERIIKCNIRLINGVLEVKSAFTVLLADHNITIPKLVYQKIAEEVRVEVQAQLTREEGSH